MAGKAEKTEEKESKSSIIFKKACKDYGIAPEFVLASRMDGDGMILVTCGGEKVVWRPGADVKPLDPVRVDGVIRKKMKPITGAKKGKK